MTTMDAKFQAELLLWRSFCILLLTILIVFTVWFELLDRDRHASDNKERARNWQLLETNQDRIMGMVGKNYEIIRELNDSVKAMEYRNRSSHSTP